MPITLDPEIETASTLEEVMDFFSRIDTSDREALLGGSDMLRALANNRTFLAERIAEELKRSEDVQKSNQYSAQVFFLGKGRDYFIRANFWPDEQDSIVRSSGMRSFFYGVPHDHNFDFLTVGYYGPGYLSDFYEYDFDEVVGYPGEKVPLRFVSREALPEGRVMLYRRSIDVHEQFPPESFSISLNVVSDCAEDISTINQYMFDTVTSTIESLGNRTSMPLICEVAAHIGDDECRDILEHLTRSHPHARGRYSAYQALARLCPVDAERIWSRAASDQEKYVCVQARQHLARDSAEA